MWPPSAAARAFGIHRRREVITREMLPLVAAAPHCAVRPKAQKYDAPETNEDRDEHRIENGENGVSVPKPSPIDERDGRFCHE